MHEPLHENRAFARASPDPVRRKLLLLRGTAGLLVAVGSAALMIVMGLTSEHRDDSLSTPLATQEMDVEVIGIDADGRIKPEHAGCRLADGKYVVNTADNRLGVRWSKVPQGAKSFAVIMVDRDAPAARPAAVFPVHLLGANFHPGSPRRAFYHWILFNIPPNIREIAPGPAAVADASGHAHPIDPMPGRSGVSDFFFFLPRGQISPGYVGPCPPVEDPVVHRYEIHVFALDTELFQAVRYHISGGEILPLLWPRTIGHGSAHVGFAYPSQPKK
jgi:phosphatidylethanolamine-binding protein (PEBP) family uncharacterized protein